MYWGGGGGGSLWAVPKVEGSAHIPRLPGSIHLVGFSDTLLVVSILGMVYMIAICGCFCSPEGVINGSCGRYGSFSAWDSPFWAVGEGRGEGGGLVGFVQSCELSVHAWPSDVYPNAKLQWHFTCGFDFRYSLWLPSLFSWKYPSYLQKNFSIGRLW